MGGAERRRPRHLRRADPSRSLRAHPAVPGSEPEAGAQRIAIAHATYMHAELAGLTDRSGEAVRSLLGSGMSMDSVRAVLDRIVQGESVMIATNQIITVVAIVFCIAATVIWLAPRPTHEVDMTKAGH